MVEQLNLIARLWWDWSAAMLWQAGLLIIVIGCIDLLIRKWAWPQLRYALWSLILIKLLLPPTLSLPSGVVPELRPVVTQALRSMNTEEPAPVIADFGLRTADLTREVGSQRGTVNLQWPGAGISDAGFGISDLTSDANPQSAIARPQLVWQAYAMMVWLIVTLILGIWLFLRLHSLCGRSACQAAAASLPQSFYNQMTDCANRLGLRRVPRVVVTKRLATPAVFGALRPVLLMPRGYLSKLSRRDTEHMLLHELAHVKRGDLVMHSLYMLLQIAYWYNPLLWLVRRQMHHLRELSCDATVANLLRERTTAYRQTLLETARRLLAASVEPGLGLLGLFEDSNRLLVRLNWLTKPTWRYRTMKRAIVVATAALMIACVLPMAQARQAAPNEVKDVTPQEVATVKIVQRDQPSEDSLSPDLKALQKHLDQMMAQQKELQHQLRALSEQRRDMSSGQERSPEGGDQASQDVRSLQKQLDEMTNQQRELQHQLRALAGEQRRGRQRDVAGADRPRHEQVEVNENIDVTVSPRESPDRPNPQRDAFESADQIDRARQEREKALDERSRALDDAKRAFGEAQAQVQKRYADRMKAWGAEMGQWKESEQMQQWQRDMQTWQQKMQTWAQDLAHQQMNGEGASPDAVKMAPMPPMPPMPAMPKMPPMPKTPATIKKEIKMRFKNEEPQHGDAESTYENTKEDFGDVFSEDVAVMDASQIDPPMPPMPPMPPEPPEPPAVAEKQDDQAEAVSQRRQMIDLPPGRLLEVANQVGSMVVRGADGPGCTVVATIKSRADTMEEAQAIADKVELIVTTPSDGKVSVVPTKLENSNQHGGPSYRVMLEVIVPRDAKVKVSQAVGDIRLTGLRSSVDALAQVGSIRAADVSGNVALNVNVGSIDFVASKDLSAKVQAKSDLGSIQSDLPLEFSKTRGPAMGSSAIGTVGRGDDNISLLTKTGSIRIRSQSADAGRAERGRRGPRPEPRPDPRPEPKPDPQPEKEF